MLTRKRIILPEPSGNWTNDAPQWRKAIVEFFQGLEGKGVLTINEAEITASQGLKFPATRVSSTDANTLDDYVEGSSSPTPTAESGSFTTVSATVNYTKVGDRCAFDCAVTITTVGTAAGYVQVTMPFTATRVCGLAGVEEQATGKALAATLNGTTLRIRLYDATTAAASGRTLRITGVVPV